MLLKRLEKWVLVLDERSNKLAGLPLLLFAYVLFCVYVPIKQRLGFANPETYAFIPAHLNAEGSIWKHIFNTEVFDTWGFQNRNLSYLVDYLDVQFIGFCLRHGFPHFLSLFHFVGVGFIVFGLWYIFVKYLKLDQVITFQLCALLLLTPSMHVSASYSRSSKMGNAIEAVILAFFSLGLLENKRRSILGLCGFFLSLLFFSFFDFGSVYLCFYWLIVNYVFLYLQEAAWWSKRMQTSTLLLGSVLMINQLAGRFALPMIHNYYYGNPYFFPNFPKERLFDFLQHPFGWLFDLFSMSVDQLRFYAGDLPFGISVVLQIILFIFTFDFCVDRWGGNRAIWGFFVLVFPIFGMWFLLRLGHPPVFYDVFRRLYYPLPFQPLLALALAFLAREAIRKFGGKSKFYVRMLLWLAIVGSASSLHAHIDTVRSCYISDSIRISAEILKGLKSFMQTKDDSQLKPEVLQNSLYISLKNYYLKST